MTTTPIAAPPAGRWSYAATAQPIGRDPARFPHANVVGEIKPHNVPGIRDGINQLRRHYNRTRGRGFAYQLATYRQTPGDVTRYDILLADPVELGRIVRSRAGQGRVAIWYGLGQVHVPDASNPIPLWQCAPTLGNRLEREVRAMYQGWMRRVQGHAGLTLPAHPPGARGPDFAHELADFLRELASELEAESR